MSHGSSQPTSLCSHAGVSYELVVSHVSSQPTSLCSQAGVSYVLVGLSNGPDYFKVDASTGEVRIKADLRDDPVKQTSYRVSTCRTSHRIR